MARGNHHDLSKYEPEEFPLYAALIDEFEAHPYGSEGYNNAKAALGPALEHHLKNNRHHPEFFGNSIEGMNLVDLMELLVDWKSATLNNPQHPGDLNNSFAMAKKKYNISPQLEQILYNTAKDFGML